MRSIGLICLLVLAGAAGLLFQTDKAHAQCAARDVAGNRRLLDDPALLQMPEAVQSAAGIPVWKTIKVGTVQTKWDLYRALDAAHCELGDAAEDMFAQPGFAVNSGKIEADLVSVSLAHLGLARASLQDIYARARKLGFALASAEIGPQLRLQYFEQPLRRVSQHRHAADRDPRRQAEDFCGRQWRHRALAHRQRYQRNRISYRGTLYFCASKKHSFVDNQERLDHFFDRSCRCARLLLALSGHSGRSD